MNAAEKRTRVRDYVLSREGKNKYTQSASRTKVDSGYSDCSSLQQRAYQKIGMEIGSYTGAQIVNGIWVQLGGQYPDESKLLPGDELFFATNYNNGRPYNVGHIEMYVGNGQISGHGSGIGPTRKDMVAYCKQRNAAGKPFIGVKRYIAVDASDSKNTGNQTLTKDPIFTAECTGNDVNVRKGPGASYGVITAWPKLNKGNRVDVLEKVGSWYRVWIQDKYEGYVYAQYISKVTEVPKTESAGTTLNRNPKWVGKVTTLLNVRSWPGIENPKIKSWPQLAAGNLIDVCDTIKAKDGSNWYYVRIAGKIYGFVSATHVNNV